LFLANTIADGLEPLRDRPLGDALAELGHDDGNRHGGMASPDSFAPHPRRSELMFVATTQPGVAPMSSSSRVSRGLRSALQPKPPALLGPGVLRPLLVGLEQERRHGDRTPRHRID